MRQYYMYILTNWNNKVLYIGVTNNIERRLFEHKHKLIAGFTQKYNLSKLVFLQSFQNIDDALKAEKQIKGWVRVKKNALIAQQNPEWTDLGKDSSLRSE